MNKHKAFLKMINDETAINIFWRLREKQLMPKKALKLLEKTYYIKRRKSKI